MSVVWYVNDQGYYEVRRCPFEHKNPVPQPECQCGLPEEEYDGCPCCAPHCECEASAWRPIIECRQPVRVRIMFPDGVHTSCCSPEAHGLPVEWWAPLYNHPVFVKPPPFSIQLMDRLMKYMWKPQFIEETLARQSPILEWLPKADSELKYGYIPIEMA